jgi:Trk K+ transport system NAD-binding subunit
VAERRFAKSVARLSESFIIVCGFGNTGSLLARGLSDAGMTAVVLDKDPERIKALYLRDYKVAMPGLQADARIPDHLIEAGLMRPQCKAVVALTHDEQVNLKIAVTARLLNPDVRVMSTSEAYEEVLATLGGDIHVIDPFQTYAKYLAATIQTPALHTLSQWLSGSPDAALDNEIPPPPKGTWIVCGYGRMGRWIHHSLESLGLPTAVIEPDIDPNEAEADNIIMGRANQASLQAAGIKDAVGVVVGTNSDSDNLSIQINAKALNPKVFVIVRQNQHRNEVVFQAAHADFIMQPSLVSARRILFLLMAPLLKTFIEDLRERDEAGDGAAVPQVMARLQQTVGGTLPRLWNLDIKRETASALVRMNMSGRRVCLGDLLRDPVKRDEHLACLALVIVSGDKTVVMPDDSQAVRPGDQVLFCGTSRAVQLLDATLNNEYTLRYLMTGRDEIRSTFLRWCFGKLRGETVEETVEVT